MSSFFCNFLCRLLHVTFPEKHTFCGVFVGVNSVRLLVCFQVSRANNVRPYRAVLYISLGVWKRETYYGGQIWASVPTEVSQNENHTKCAKSPSHRRGEHCSPGLTPLPCRASPLKRRRFVKASSLEEVARSAGGINCN